MSPSSMSSSSPSARGPGAANPRISVLIASRNRPAEVRKCIESVLAQDYTDFEIVVLDDGSDVPLQGEVGVSASANTITWLRNEAPTGVSGARNSLVENATGDILVFVDDDAWFVSNDELKTIDAIFASDSELGIIAFKIYLNGPESGELQVPFSKKVIKRDPGITDRRQKAGYFVGAGHAISTRVFAECGLYPTEFIYGHEELDLSYRAVNHGFSIIYEPALAVIHAPASSQLAGAGKKGFESYYVTRNRIWLAHRNLPIRYAISYTVLWSAYYFAKSLKHGQIINWFAAMKDGIFGIDRSKRQPLAKKAIGYLAGHHGRLWR